MPARVRNRSGALRAIVLVATLQIAIDSSWPMSRACSIAPIVSAVSPDCEMPTTSVRGSATVSR